MAIIATWLGIIKLIASTEIDSKFVVNAEKFGQSSVSKAAEFVKLVNGEELTAEDLKGAPDPTANSSQFHTSSWWGCLKEKIGPWIGWKSCMV
ncbi:hypothetical protein [Bacillus sp. NSP9.1]|uniref:hypothetical protein n=1 Tax=Bacillus sp. NSP9.1 TaxID=1071078 RepID=UPI0004033B85|nr:hypothetical protein [Bacillus sp. NSP9.1]QHZ46557.1 hypothetical protein M654_009750 [Bacillus sp. NSP9.1]